MAFRILAAAVIVFASISPLFAEDEVKTAELDGIWYPASVQKLSADIQGYLANVPPVNLNGKVFGIIVPHAGYEFSGPIAAYAYKAASSKPVKTIILLGFSHKKFFNGICVYDKGAFRTPLGDIEVDADLSRKLMEQSPRIISEPLAFGEENSIEMQIPFIQEVFKNAKLVAISFGTRDYNDALALADALSVVLAGRQDFLVVASTDLSHFHGYDEANSIDGRLIEVLKMMDGKIAYDDVRMGAGEMCGVMPVSTMLMAAKKMRYDKIEVLKYANSGDTSGRKEEVVGYLAAALYGEGIKEARKAAAGTENIEKGSDMLNDEQRKRLLRIARESITSYLRDGKKKRFEETDAALSLPLGTFVTIHEGGQLRGCIGNMAAAGPLYRSVADLAITAATADPRFKPVTSGELDKIDIEISVLSPLKKVAGADDIKIPGHGVLVRQGISSGVYLPQVATESGWSKEEFLTSLCESKAGIDPNAWQDPETELYVFTAEVFGEKRAAK